TQSTPPETVICFPSIEAFNALHDQKGKTCAFTYTDKTYLNPLGGKERLPVVELKNEGEEDAPLNGCLGKWWPF
ncbi:MAG: hypothetical protein AAF570_28980, partial [Bacteroidota bacterium]